MKNLNLKKIIVDLNVYHSKMLDYDFRRFDLTMTHIIFLIIFVENHIKVIVCFIYIMFINQRIFWE